MSEWENENDVEEEKEKGDGKNECEWKMVGKERLGKNSCNERRAKREIISFNVNQIIILQIKFRKNDKDEKKDKRHRKMN